MNFPVLSPKDIKRGRYMLGTTFVALALFDFILGNPGNLVGRWQWLSVISVGLLGPWGVSIAQALIGAAFLYWGYVSKD